MQEWRLTSRKLDFFESNIESASTKNIALYAGMTFYKLRLRLFK